MYKIALLSTNKNKFSETFIQTQIQGLAFEVYLYSNGYLPTELSVDKGIHFKEIPKKFFGGSDLRNRISNSFKRNKIQAVLAQYGPAGVEIMSVCENLELPLIVHFHGYDAYRDDVLKSYGKNYKDLFKIAKAIIVVSRDMHKKLLSLGCPKEKLFLIPYGIDTSLFQENEEISRTGFIACGRFVEKKGFEYTLAAFKKLVDECPDAQLKIIGSGPLEEKLKKIVLEEKMKENVHFIGRLKPKEVAEALCKAQVFVQHSIKAKDNDSEGTPLSILEAMSTGLAIISTKHAGINELIEDKKNGYLLEEKDVEAMFQKMLTLHKDSKLALEMGKNARSSILKKYQKSRYLKEVESLIYACLA